MNNDHSKPSLAHCTNGHDPAPRQKLEAFDALRSLNDLNRPRSAMGERGYELIAAVNPIGKDMAQLGEAAS